MTPEARAIAIAWGVQFAIKDEHRDAVERAILSALQAVAQETQDAHVQALEQAKHDAWQRALEITSDPTMVGHWRDMSARFAEERDIDKHARREAEAALLVAQETARQEIEACVQQVLGMKASIQRICAEDGINSMTRVLGTVRCETLDDVIAALRARLPEPGGTP